MSVIEQINDALDDENPSQVLTEITTSLVESGDSDGLEDAFRGIKKNTKQPTIANEAIAKCFEMIKVIEDDESKLKLIRPLIAYLTTFPFLQNDFQPVIDEYEKVCMKTGHYSNFARFLLDRGIDKNEPDRTKLEFYLRIGELFIQEGIIDRANGMLNEANNYRFIRSSPKELLYRYDLLNAEINVTKQNFEVAADLFYQISQNYPKEKKTALKRSIIFTITSPPGPKRDAVFHKISADDDAQLLPIFNLLDRLNNRQIISDEDIETLFKEISSEKSIKKEDFKNNMKLHNLTQIAYLYSVISVERMSQIIGVSVDDTVEMVEQMIDFGRLKAKIDQPNGMIVYNRDESRTKEVEIMDFSEAVDSLAIEIQKLGK